MTQAVKIMNMAHLMALAVVALSQVIAMVRLVIGPGIADRILKAGETAPAFELVDTTGQSVRSADLLARGPLVVTFYRGFW